MKKISLSKRTWCNLRKIKNEQNLGKFSNTIDYLAEKNHVLKGESLDEIRLHVDSLKNAKNLEEKQPQDSNDGIEIQCMTCAENFFVKKSDQDETGVFCPKCGCYFGFLFLDYLDDEIK